MKKRFSNSVDYLLFSNCWVALCLGAVVLGIAHLYCIDDCWLYGLFAFCGTFVTYNFHRLVRKQSFQKEAIITERNLWLKLNKSFIFISSALVCITAFILLFFLPLAPTSILLLGISGVIVLFYAVPIPGFGKALRQLSGLKSVWIVLVWVILVCIPLINRHKFIDWKDLFHVGLFVYIQIVPFDIRDLEHDSKKMYTLPQLAGVRNARLITTILTGFLVWQLVLIHPFHWFLAVTIGVSLIGLWWKQHPSVNRYLELLWDGALLLFGLYYYVIPCAHS